MGIKAGIYKDYAIEKIPNFDEIGRPGTDRTYSRERLEDETLCHLYKSHRTLTGWISATSSLLRALQILFIEHGEGGQIFIIDTASCSDIFTAPELRDCLPGLKDTST